MSERAHANLSETHTGLPLEGQGRFVRALEQTELRIEIPVEQSATPAPEATVQTEASASRIETAESRDVPDCYEHNNERWRLGVKLEEEISSIQDFLENDQTLSWLMSFNPVLRIAVGAAFLVGGILIIPVPGPFSFAPITVGITMILGTKIVMKSIRFAYKFLDIFSTETVKRFWKHGRFTRKPEKLNHQGRAVRRTREAFDWGE